MAENDGGRSRLEEKVYGCLLGGLIGDAMGAPVEGWTHARIAAEYGPEGVTDFDGQGTDDTAIREQLIHALLEHGGHVSCDEFAATFRAFRANYGKWWVPVRNMVHKLEGGVTLPVDAGWGNAPSSSSAMAISPMGLINAGNPRQAARETFDVAGLIHSGPTGFCRDAACAMAAAVAAAFLLDATPDSMAEAATRYLHPVSAQVMRERIGLFRQMAREAGDYADFRARIYAERLCAEQCDSRETVPTALALFAMAGDNPERAIRQGVNFGRDADTIGTMVGGLCGALHGASGLPDAWVQKVEANPNIRYRDLASRLAALIRQRAQDGADIARRIASLSGPTPDAGT